LTNVKFSVMWSGSLRSAINRGAPRFKLHI
jgi:hypothetical protein